VKATQEARDYEDKNNLLLILKIMQELETFDICRNSRLLSELLPREYVTGQAEWRAEYAMGIIDLCLRERSPADVGAK